MSRHPQPSPSPEAIATLRARARELAKPTGDGPLAPSIPVLEFRLAQERYAIALGQVRGVYALKDLTALPGTPPFMRGIVNVRGRIVAVVDLKAFFDLPAEGLIDLHRIILLEGGGLELGLLADEIGQVRSIPVDTLHPPLPTVTGIRSGYVRGITAERLVVLDADHILADPKLLIDHGLAQ